MKESSLAEKKALGRNRTGLGMSPLDAQKLANREGLGSFAPGSFAALVDLRRSLTSAADNLGTVPPPGTLKGAATTLLHKLKGESPERFIDKLGERLAFERTGVRLYEGLITKCSAQPEFFTPEHLSTLESIRADEFKHFQLVADVLRSLGADPTAMTPAADIAGIMACGLLQTVTETRISAQDSLQALLVAELTDHDAWNLLVRYAEAMNLEEVAESFRSAALAEQGHLVHLRRLVELATLPEAKVLH